MFDRTKADRAVRFVETFCSYPKGNWSDDNRFRLRPWQKDIVTQLFGTINPDGTRQYRRAYISFGRKNGKTTLVACLALYLLLADGERGGEILIAANDRKQASILFDAAAVMVRSHPVLNARCHIVPSQKVIRDTKSNSVMRALSADTATQLGQDASAWIYDELAFAPRRELFDILSTSTGSRRQPLGIIITTASWHLSGVGYEQYEYARRVRDGEVDDPSYLPVIFELAPQDDWTDERNWHKANPALGDFRSLTEMRDAYHQALAIPAQQVAFRTLYLNQWLQANESRFIEIADWNACRADYDESDLHGLPAYGGLDLSATQDLTALVLAIPRDGHIYLVPRLFLPDDRLVERGLRDGVEYAAWRDAGHLITTPGPVVDYETIRREIHRLADEFDIREIAYDRWNAIALVQQLQADGLTMVEMGQGYRSMSPATKSFHSAVLAGKIKHPGNSVLDWNISNLMVDQDAAGNVKPSKSKSKHRIDGAVAAIMAHDRAQRHIDGIAQPVLTGPSIYETRGPIFL